MLCLPLVRRCNFYRQSMLESPYGRHRGEMSREGKGNEYTNREGILRTEASSDCTT